MFGFDPRRLHFIVQKARNVTTPKQPPKPKPGERDEPVKIDLDPQVAVAALLRVKQDGGDADDVAQVDEL